MQIQNDFQGKDWENSILPTQDLDPWKLSQIINRLKKEQNICSSLEKWIYKWEEEGGVGGSLLLTHPGIQCHFHPPPAHRHSLRFHLGLEPPTSLTEAAWARRGRHVSHITRLELALAPLIRQGWRIQMFIIISKRRKERKPKPPFLMCLCYGTSCAHHKPVTAIWRPATVMLIHFRAYLKRSLYRRSELVWLRKLLRIPLPFFLPRGSSSQCHALQCTPRPLKLPSKISLILWSKQQPHPSVHS